MQMKNFCVGWGLALSVCTLTACGDREGSDNSGTLDEQSLAAASSTQLPNSASPDIVPKVTSEMLQGSWISNCKADTNGSSIGFSEIYSGNDYVVEAILFGDSNCSLPVVEVSISGSYNLRSAYYTVTGAAVTELDALGDRMTFRPLTVAFANYLILDNFCNRTNWLAGEAQDVGNCSEFRGDINNYDIVEFDGNSHFLGENDVSLDGSTASKRPVNIDYSIRYSKIQDDDSSQTNESAIIDGIVTPDSILEAYLQKAISLRP